MEKQDRIIEILAWLCIFAVIVFCIRFNYQLYGQDYDQNHDQNGMQIALKDA